MLLSYVQLDDGTQFAYSETRDDGTVRVAVERPVDFGFEKTFDLGGKGLIGSMSKVFLLTIWIFCPSSLDQTLCLSSSLQNAKKPDRRHRRWPPDAQLLNGN